ncbi:MAG: hypothetical protein ACE5KA_09205 [Nitrososphaerales archaeon]
MKSKGLVIIGLSLIGLGIIIMIIGPLLFYSTIIVVGAGVEAGPFRIFDIHPVTAIYVFVGAVILWSGTYLVAKGFL